MNRNPRAHWILLSGVLLVVVVSLLFSGYARHDVGRSATPTGPEGAAAPLAHSILFAGRDGALRTTAVPAGVAVLTFDDGPDPRWTPRVLDVLHRAGVPATFFVVGTRATDHLRLVARARSEGNEVGAHTFTHADITTVSSARRNLELSLGGLALAGSDGRAATLFRPPYSSTPGAVTARQRDVWGRLAREGYVVVLSDRDSRDWAQPGVSRIVRNAVPDDGAGAVILFHDGGGDRSQTVAALPRVIAELRSRGYRFATVGGAVGLSREDTEPRVDRSTRLHAEALRGVLRFSDGVALLLAWVLVPLGVLAVGRSLALLLLARRHSRRTLRRTTRTDFRPAVTVVVPAYNEAVGIAASVRSVVDTDYPGVAVIVVDDGSTDGTAEIVESLGLPGVTVVRQQNHGKAAALDTGLRLTTDPVVVMVDGDTVFERGTLSALVRPLADDRIGAVSGNTKVGNRRRILGRWQHLEYVVGFNLDRRMYDLLRCMPTVPGAIGAFRRQALLEVGGVSSDTLAEDTDLTMAVNRAGWVVVYEQDARAWTEAPASLRTLWRQRYRWCYGTLQAVWKHRGALRGRGNDRRLGFVGLPYLVLFQVALPLLAPLLDLYALYGLTFLDRGRVAAYWLGFLGLHLVTAAYALRLDRERLRTLWALPLQQLVYRQLMYLVVVQSVVAAVSGIRLRWHKLERAGLSVGDVPVRT